MSGICQATSRACAVLLAVVLVPALHGQVGSPPGGTTTGRDSTAEPDKTRTVTSPEQQLWQRIAALEQSQPATQPYETWIDATRQRRQALLERVRLYLTLYPGGPHRDEAIRFEMVTLFELGTMQSGALDPLCKRVAEILRQRPSAAAVQEAAYWDIVCQRLGKGAASNGPASEAVCGPDTNLLTAYRDYVKAYPRSRYVPRLARLLFVDAARRGEWVRMHAIVAQLREHFEGHSATEALAAKWRRAADVELPFCLTFETADGHWIDTRAYRGHPVLIVVWAGYDQSARAGAQSVEQLRKARPQVRVVGVNLDETQAEMTAASRELGIGWPQLHDGLGWGGEFVRAWGIRCIPHVFVLDRAGRLLGSAGGDGWLALAREALRAESGASRSQAGGRGEEPNAP